ncbi:hypothetical protein BGX34_008124 [Mortierella sp. NVP85]|nr:hypothetical protein BGX34_008124 [Mortierella sp. NVP85]
MSGAAAPRLNYPRSHLLRQYSTLEIEVEYISTTQNPPPDRPSDRKNDALTEHDPNKLSSQHQNVPGQHYSLNSLSEDEEDSGAGVQAPTHHQQPPARPAPPPIRHSTRPNVASLRRVARPVSDQFTQQSLTSYHLMDDPFARMYTPSLPPIPQSTPLDSVPLPEEQDQAQGQQEKETAGAQVEKKEEKAVVATTVVEEEEVEEEIVEEETTDRDVGTGSIDPTSSSNVELFSIDTSSNGQSVAHSLMGYHAQHSYHRQEEQDQCQQPHDHDSQQHPQLHSIQAAASFQSSRSPLLPSSHITHDETPVLSSTGSQSDDEDEDEVLDSMQVPIDCLELAEGDDSDSYEEGRSITDILGPPLRRATSVGGPTGAGSRKTSVRSSSVKSASGRSASGQSVSGKSASGQSTSDKSAVDQNIGGNSVGGQSVGGQSANGQSVSGQSVGGQSANGQSTNGTSSHGDTPSGKSSLRRRTHNGSTGSRLAGGRRREDSISPTQEGQEAPEMETQETLRRERTRILERTVVNSYRTIEFRDVTNIRPLKRGGYGEIHVAEWSRLRVVLKRALPDHTEGMEQFDQELEILKRVHDYDFIVPFYGVTIDPRNNVRCMVMKYCSNGNLCTFLELHHENLTWLERYRLCIEVAKGLEFLHKSGFHHRDLHSGNILLDDKRTAMLCDFGLSRSSSRDQTTEVAATVGVASFLAPERFPAQRPVYTASCDIYSLGVIFWHITSGRIPFANRLREPMLLRELMDGLREEIVPGTPREFRDLIVKCWDVKPSRRLKIDVVIAILQTLMAKPSEPLHQISTGFAVRSDTTSAALPVPPDLDSKMANLERASNILNRMVFDIQDPMMKETVNYIERTRAYFRDRGLPQEPYSPSNPPKTPIYLCPLVGDVPAFNYYLSQGGYYYNPINESSEQTGDTALHLACLFLESPMDTIKVLVELGADINLENLQGYTPVMILVSSNTQYCYEALKYFVMRGARIPAYIRNPITPLNSAQLYALNLVNESRKIVVSGGGGTSPTQGTWKTRPRISLPNQNVYQERGGRKVERVFAQGRPLIHVVAAMQDDYRILDCLCEAGLDPAVSFAGETALVAAAAHLRIRNIEWLLNNDLDVSTEASIQRAIKVVKLLHLNSYNPYIIHGDGHARSRSASSTSASLGRMNDSNSREYLDDIRDLGKYSWAGVAYGEADRMSKDMVGPVLNLLEQWTGNRRIANRRDVATKLKLMYGSLMDVTSGGGSRNSSVSVASTSSDSSTGSQGSYHAGSSNRVGQIRGGLQGARSVRKNQRHLIDQVLNEKPRFWGTS